MKKDGGTYVVPVVINDAITLDFTVDSGAADVSIPEDVVTTLMRTGTIRGCSGRANSALQHHRLSADAEELTTETNPTLTPGGGLCRLPPFTTA